MTGVGVDPAAVARAIELSATKYCSVGSTLSSGIVGDPPRLPADRRRDRRRDVGRGARRGPRQRDHDAGGGLIDGKPGPQGVRSRRRQRQQAARPRRRAGGRSRRPGRLASGADRSRTIAGRSSASSWSPRSRSAASSCRRAAGRDRRRRRARAPSSSPATARGPTSRPTGSRPSSSTHDFTLLNVKTPYIGEIDGTDLYIPYTDLAGPRVRAADRQVRQDRRVLPVRRRERDRRPDAAQTSATRTSRTSTAG